ncbi:Hypothetical protein NCS54_00476800 [Fusarium falciforme]|uniref:Hypothetical protein n=1 Tax=Fusarium falciforme TaxID=195108 RepID=UPI0023007E8A|nr:Hypothetical protein NCS54_00476800 [Fusarium falciforme]WAO87459.1 Hypothetical protein NCS54_00476800 [Fusarium falciforme]
MSNSIISVSVGNHESKEVMVSLIQRDINFFPYTDPEARLAAVREIFAPDVVQFDFDGTTHHSHDGLLEHPSFLLDAEPLEGGASVLGKLKQINFTATICRFDEKQPTRAQRNLILALKH